MTRAACTSRRSRLSWSGWWCVRGRRWHERTGGVRRARSVNGAVEVGLQFLDHRPHLFRPFFGDRQGYAVHVA
jgi:hypothetical protein